MVKQRQLSKKQWMQLKQTVQLREKDRDAQSKLTKRKLAAYKETPQTVKGRIVKNVSKQLSKRQDSSKAIKIRERAAKGILRATGVIQGGQRYAGAGRPRGVYKYGVPIQVYKAQQRQKKALYQQYQQEQYARLKTKGFTPEQVQQLQQQQALQELEQPTENQVRQERIQRIQSNVQQMQQPIQIIRPQVQQGYGRIIPRSQRIQPGRSVADEELDFRKWSAETTISPNTQRLLDRIRRVQNKGKSDNVEMQRRLRERNMVGRSMNLMKAHENMIDTRMDFTKVDMAENILGAPNIWKENVNNPNILTSNRPNILQTKEAGNSLFF